MVDANLPPQVLGLGQQHVLQFWDELNPTEQTNLIQQLGQIDWKLVETFSREAEAGPTAELSGCGAISPPRCVVRRPANAAELAELAAARELGEEILRAGKVGAILLAGGQGTRLGFPHPKGTFPIGPVSGKSLFEILAEQIVALINCFGRPIPYMVMTSEGTHHETIAFFQQNAYFGLNPADVFFFQQGYAPSLDSRTGELLLSEKGGVCMSPDGHGGLLAALLKAGLFQEMRRRGIEYLFSHQVDNPLVKACDPEFIGLHVKHQAEVSTKVVAKTGPDEKVGVAVDLDGRTAIVEYSDLPTALANQCEPDGKLRYWAGSTAIHLFNRSFLESVATSEHSLPWHRARKKIPFIDRQGHRVQPDQDNGIKYERFLFDTLPMAKIALIVETIRSDEFAPLKNKSGDFSPDYVRHHMIRVATDWLRAAGLDVPENAVVEISPCFARTAEELAAHKSELANFQFDHPVYIGRPTSPSSKVAVKEPASTGRVTNLALTNPIVFDSFYRPQIWGGRGLSAVLGRTLPDDKSYGEAWDLSPLRLHTSRVIEGSFEGRDLNDLWTNCRELLAGPCSLKQFPFLAKWLECRELLSLQVHPNDEIAQRVLNEPFGKSEAWVVISVEPTARVFAGLKPGVTKADVLSHLKMGAFEECLHSFQPQVGDCISLPAGTIHAAGGGLIVAEIQQSSDATFRLFDWNRVGLDGKPRELHIDKALEAIDWNQGAISAVIPRVFPCHDQGVIAEQLVDGAAFQMERYSVQNTFTPSISNELVVWMVLGGAGRLTIPSTGYRREFKLGQTVLVPASSPESVWESIDQERELRLLCTRLPKKTASN